MEERYIYVFICWIEKFITVGSIIVISLAFHKLFPTIFFLVFFLRIKKANWRISWTSFINVIWQPLFLI
ncbi:accessory gene regulator B family protein [Roseburia intestinalis]